MIYSSAAAHALNTVSGRCRRSVKHLIYDFERSLKSRFTIFRGVEEIHKVRQPDAILCRGTVGVTLLKPDINVE